MVSIWGISYSQAELGYIKGTITNEKGELLSGVKIEIANLSQTTLEDGVYHINGIQKQQEYNVKFSHSEYETKIENILLSADAGIIKNIALKKINNPKTCTSPEIIAKKIINKTSSNSIENSNTNKLNTSILRGTIVDSANNPLNRIKINITFQLSNNVRNAINNEAKENSCLIDSKEIISSKVFFQVKKTLKTNNNSIIINELDNKWEFYILSDSKGKFNIDVKNIPINKYILHFSSAIYNNKIKQVNISKDGLNLGNIKMYKNCENTGGSFDADCLFPAWATKNNKKDSKREEIQGVYGKNKDGENGGDKIALSLIPNIINIILKFISPIVVAMFIFAGIRFIYAGSDEEDLNKAKDFFLYAGIGLAFIIMSYTLMKVLYFFLK